MAALFILGLSLISCFISINANEYVPVLMWESSSDVKREHKVPALPKISSNDFQDLLTTKLYQKDIVVVFVEENLSVEDFSWQDSQKHTAFPRLQALASSSESVTYIPNVHTPVHGIKTLGNKWRHIPFTTHNWDDQVSHAKDSILLINLNDAKEGEDRHSFLKRHDNFISKVYSELLNKYNSVAAIYTAQHPSWFEEESFPKRLRTKRDIDFGGSFNETTLYNGSNTVIMFLPTPPLLNGVSLGTPSSVEYTGDTNEYNAILTVTYDTHVLTFHFQERPAGYWAVDEVSVQSGGGTARKLNSTQIQAPKGFSYHCGQNVTYLSYPIKEDNTYDFTLIFPELQVQLYFEAADESGIRQFGDAYDCASFFTIGILSGFFVIFIFSWIMSMGILMIMDIKTMDRFDDPKGKTISVNPTE